MRRYGLDSLHSWITCAGCTLVVFMTYGLYAGSAGILYVAFMAATSSPIEQAAWLFSTSSAMGVLAGPVCTYLVTRVSIRTISISGSLINAIATSVCFLTHDFYILFAFYTILGGFGIFQSILLLPALINNNFKKHRTTAMGVFVSAGAAGGLVFPLVTQKFLEFYDIKGAFLLLGGISLHAVAGAMLLTETDQKTKRKQTKSNDTAKSGNVEMVKYNEGMVKSKDNGEFHRNVEEERWKRSVVCQKCVLYERNSKELSISSSTGFVNSNIHNCDVSETENVWCNNQRNIRGSSQHLVTGINPNQKECVHLCGRTTESTFSESKQKKVERKATEVSVESTRHKLLQICLLRGFHLSNVLSIVVTIYHILFAVIIVDDGIKKGNPKHQAVHLLTVYSFGQIFGRLGLSWILDRNFVTKQLYLFVSCTLLGLACFALTFCVHFGVLAFLSALIGVLLGNLNPVAKVIFADYMSKELMLMAIPLSYTMSGALGFSRGILISVFCDGGSYNNLYIFMGSISVFSALPWLLEYLRIKKRLNKENGTAISLPT